MVDICCVFSFLFFSLFLSLLQTNTDTQSLHLQKREHNNLPIWIYYEMHTRMPKKMHKKMKSYSSLAMPSGQ